MKPIIVIGAGAAGIMASWRAAQMGAKVVLLEKTDRIGTKILISGGGKCNITHDGPLEDVLRAFRPNEARFIRPACYRWRPQDVVEMLTSRGLEVYTRADGRIFPTHQTAKDVVAILETYLNEQGVTIHRNTPVQTITAQENGFHIETNRHTFESQHVILCVGGSSYPKSGTTGDGWPWATQLGHTIVPILAALAPMELELAGMELKAGVALRDIVLKARLKGKELARWRGDLLFTHRGVSGPTVLGISRVVAENWPSGPANLEVDLVPDFTFEQIQARWMTWKQENQKKLVKNGIRGLVPESLEKELLDQAKISPEETGQSVSKKALNLLVETIKAWPIGTVSRVPLEKGECVAGGVTLSEVDPHSMRSNLCPGLYLCGEVLDIAGPVGGYNLQAAWATGYVAGETAAEDWLSQSQ
ncbi:MAG: NAD(P)/FAD-dependent oxidoreductase [Fimbriimonadaceae bacterium]|jgi:hypothetical protein|nr:NAD(P)/FAD-dependent oxidoreductase [Fimbriimonadaceae bacterium]